MQKYQSIISGTNGSVIRNVPVTVLKEDGSLAEIFLDREGQVPAPNPLATDSRGVFYFYAVNGRYSLRTSVDGITITDADAVLLNDPEEIATAGPIADAVLRAEAAAQRAEFAVEESGIPELVGAAQNAAEDAQQAVSQAGVLTEQVNQALIDAQQAKLDAESAAQTAASTATAAAQAVVDDAVDAAQAAAGAAAGSAQSASSAAADAANAAAAAAEGVVSGAVSTATAQAAIASAKAAEAATKAAEAAASALSVDPAWRLNPTGVQSINGGQLAGMRNKIINGAMLVDQRNAGSAQTITAGAALSYCVDSFYAYCTGANITGQQVDGSIANTKRYRFTGAASNTGIGFGTRLEAVNTAMMAGQTATLQAKLASSSLTAISWTAYYANTKDSFGTLASPTRTQIATGTFTINSTEATYSAQISIPSGATTGIEVVFTGGALLVSQTLTIGDVQLELGSVATPFESRPNGFELSLCQDYFELLGGVTNQRLAVGQATSATNGEYLITYKRKRAAPTLTLSGTLQVSGSGFGLSSFSGSSFTSIGLSSCSLAVTGATSLATGNASFLLSISNGVIGISSEL